MKKLFYILIVSILISCSSKDSDEDPAVKKLTLPDFSFGLANVANGNENSDAHSSRYSLQSHISPPQYITTDGANGTYCDNESKSTFYISVPCGNLLYNASYIAGFTTLPQSILDSAYTQGISYKSDGSWFAVDYGQIGSETTIYVSYLDNNPNFILMIDLTDPDDSDPDMLFTWMVDSQGELTGDVSILMNYNMSDYTYSVHANIDYEMDKMVFFSYSVGVYTTNGIPSGTSETKTSTIIDASGDFFRSKNYLYSEFDTSSDGSIDFTWEFASSGSYITNSDGSLKEGVNALFDKGNPAINYYLAGPYDVTYDINSIGSYLIGYSSPLTTPAADDWRYLIYESMFTEASIITGLDFISGNNYPF